MRLLIAGLATGLLLAGAPAFADSWKDESGRGWRGSGSQHVGHRDHGWGRHDRHWDRRHHHGHSRHRQRHRHHHHYHQPQLRHHHYHHYPYTYRYPPFAGHVITPNVYFSWSN